MLTHAPSCKENGPLPHLVWILVFDDQHDQVGLMNLQVFVLLSNRVQMRLGQRRHGDSMINISSKTLEAPWKTQKIKQSQAWRMKLGWTQRLRRNEVKKELQGR